jgi:hypothetical protein
VNQFLKGEIKDLVANLENTLLQWENQLKTLKEEEIMKKDMQEIVN